MIVLKMARANVAGCTYSTRQAYYYYMYKTEDRNDKIVATPLLGAQIHTSPDVFVGKRLASTGTNGRFRGNDLNHDCPDTCCLVCSRDCGSIRATATPSRMTPIAARDTLPTRDSSASLDMACGVARWHNNVMAAHAAPKVNATAAQLSGVI